MSKGIAENSSDTTQLRFVHLLIGAVLILFVGHSYSSNSFAFKSFEQNMDSYIENEHAIASIWEAVHAAEDATRPTNMLSENSSFSLKTDKYFENESKVEKLHLALLSHKERERM